MLDHLEHLFVDLQGWIDGVVAHRVGQRDGLARELDVLRRRGADLDRDERLVRRDYMRQLRARNERAAELATAEIERIEAERVRLDGQVSDLEARLAEWDGRDAADEGLDWWNEFGAAIRGEMVNAESVRDANTALRERFAPIFVRSRRGGAPRLDLILKEREPGAPLVSSRLWADVEQPADGSALVTFIQEPTPSDRSRTRPSESERLTFVYVHLQREAISAYE